MVTAATLRRRAKRELEAQKKRRKNRWEMIGGVLMMSFVIITGGVTFFLWIFAETIWPIK